jgi:hypothetical protein
MVQTFPFDVAKQEDLVLVAAETAHDDTIAVVISFHTEISVKLASNLNVRHREGKVLQ